MKWLYALILIILLSCSTQQSPQVASKPNILFIAVDDLRPELGCYGNPVVISPNLDELASEGLVFANHFVQVPTCGASRLCLLSGMRPSNPSQLSNQAIEVELSDKPEIVKELMPILERGNTGLFNSEN